MIKTVLLFGTAIAALWYVGSIDSRRQRARDIAAAECQGDQRCLWEQANPGQSYDAWLIGLREAEAAGQQANYPWLFR
jgi:hypothetical protein